MSVRLRRSNVIEPTEKDAKKSNKERDMVKHD
jgi:hypothetical protein